MRDSKERLKILMVEDEQDFQTIVRGWLSPHYDIETLGDGEGLLEAIEDFEPDLVVLDVMLPGPDGFKLCSAIRADERFAGLPILFLTACTEDADFIKSLRVGGTAYLMKPVARKQLLAKIQELAAEPFAAGIKE